MRTYHQTGIGGWLLLPMIGLFISPARLAYILVTVHIPLVLSGAWGILTAPGSEAYHPLWGPLLLFEIFANTLLLCWAIVLLILLFTKSHHFPKWIILFYLASLVIVAVDTVLGGLIPAVAEQNDPSSKQELIRAMIATAIWVPYFIKSERVKNTFIKPGGQPLQSTSSAASNEFKADGKTIGS